MFKKTTSLVLAIAMICTMITVGFSSVLAASATFESEVPTTTTCTSDKNLIENHDLEAGGNGAFWTGFHGWGWGGTWPTVVSDTAHSGSKSLQIKGAATWAPSGTNSAIELEANTDYVFSIWYKAENVPSGAAYLFKLLIGDSTKEIYLATDGEWHQLALAFNSGDSTSLKTYYYLGNSADDARLLFDDAYLFVEESVAPSFSDTVPDKNICAADKNLIENHDLEAGGNGAFWTGFYGWGWGDVWPALQTGNAHSGEKSLQIKGASWSPNGHNADIELEASTDYMFSIWYKVDNVPSGSAFLVKIVVGDSIKEFGLTADGEWHQLAVNFNTGDATKMHIYYYLGNSAGATLLFDDAYLCKAEDATAIPQIKNYTVTYVADGVTVDTQTVEEGSDAVVPEVPAKEGYTAAWDNDGKNITADITINAVYTIKTYTVTYVADGVTVNTQTVDHGSDATVPEVPAKEGYNGAWDHSGQNITTNTTINAVYSDKSYTVTYVANGVTVDTQTVIHGASAVLPEVPAKEGHDGAWDNDGKNITADITINAVYTIKTYTVTYVADGTTVGTVTVEHGKDATAPVVPAKEGYTGAWDKDGKNITADTTINVVYTIKTYTVTYVAEGQTVDTVTVDHGASATAPAVPAKEGYTGAWDKDGKNITADTTITAVYTKIAAAPTFSEVVDNKTICEDDKNLIPNSGLEASDLGTFWGGFSNIGKGWGAGWPEAITGDAHNGDKSFAVESAGSWDPSNRSGKITLEKNTNYVFSIWYKIKGNENTNFISKLFVGNYTTDVSLTADSEWHQIAVAFNTGDESIFEFFYWMGRIDGATLLLDDAYLCKAEDAIAPEGGTPDDGEEPGGPVNPGTPSDPEGGEDDEEEEEETQPGFSEEAPAKTECADKNNLIPNSGLEASDLGSFWGSFNNICTGWGEGWPEILTGDAHSGNKHFAVDSAATWDPSNRTAKINLKKNTNYVFSIWYKIKGNDDAEFLSKLFVGRMLKEVGLTADGEWHQIAVTFNTGNENTFEFYYWMRGIDGATLLLDDAYLFEVDKDGNEVSKENQDENQGEKPEDKPEGSTPDTGIAFPIMAVVVFFGAAVALIGVASYKKRRSVR